MAWTTPKTWISEILTSNDMNTYLTDNTQYLYDELTATVVKQIDTDTSTQYSTTSTSFVAIDATDLNITLTLSGEKDVLITFAGTFYAAGGATTLISELLASGVSYEIVHMVLTNLERQNASYAFIISGLSAGSHTFRPRWRSSNGTEIRMINTTTKQFTVREIDT